MKFLKFSPNCLIFHVFEGLDGVRGMLVGLKQQLCKAMVTFELLT